MPTVSIIIPNYNHGQYLQQRIDSVINQSFTDFEIIILDDYSNDNSKDIIEQYKAHPKVSKIEYNTYNAGSPFIQWEKGIKMAEGTYIWIAESDDYCLPSFLDTCILQLKENPSVGIAYTNSTLLRNELEEDVKHIFEENVSQSGISIINKYFIFDNYIPNASAVVFRKSLINQKILEKLRSYKWCGDWFLWVSLLKKSNLIYIPQKLNIYRRHAKSTSIKSQTKGLDFKEMFSLLLSFVKKDSQQHNLKATFIKKWTEKLKDRYINQPQKALIYFPPYYWCLILHLRLLFTYISNKLKKK
jgi:glycosyltransferase involved in cell wall biosynthesis